MSAHDDMRLVDDLDQNDEVRSALRAGIDDQVDDYDFNAGLAAHIAAVAALPTAVAVTAQASSAAGLSAKALLTWIGIPVVSASVVAAVWLGTADDKPARPNKQLNAIAKTVPIAAAPTQAVAVETVAPVAATEAVETAAAVTTQNNKPAARAVSGSKLQRTASVTRAPKPEARPVREAVVDEPAETTTRNVEVAVSAPVIEAKPSAAEQEAIARAAAQQAEAERQAREQARREAEARLKREMTQLMQAKQALASNPARALSLAQAGEQEFRDSLFSEERQHVLLLALIKLGRVDEAERRAQPFLRAHPDSPFARRVRNALDDAR